VTLSRSRSTRHLLLCLLSIPKARPSRFHVSLHPFIARKKLSLRSFLQAWIVMRRPAPVGSRLNDRAEPVMLSPRSSSHLVSAFVGIKGCCICEELANMVVGSDAVATSANSSWPRRRSRGIVCGEAWRALGGLVQLASPPLGHGANYQHGKRDVGRAFGQKILPNERSNRLPNASRSWQYLAHFVRPPIAILLPPRPANIASFLVRVRIGNDLSSWGGFLPHTQFFHRNQAVLTTLSAIWF